MHLDIFPFRLPNTPINEIRFEEPRDILRVGVVFRCRSPRAVAVSYLRRVWPESRVECHCQGEADLRNPMGYGWIRIDDHYNTAWQKAATVVTLRGRNAVEIAFLGLRRELPKVPGIADYDVRFRRTLGLRIDAESAAIRKVRVFTTSPASRRRLRIELDAGRKTPGKTAAVEAYNARVLRLTAGPGAAIRGGAVALHAAVRRMFFADVETLSPESRFSFDAGQVMLRLDREAFTIFLNDLTEKGPIWYEEAGVFLADAADPTSFAEYRARHRAAKTVARQVREHREQSLGQALLGQPRPHPVANVIGCKGARQLFRLEPTGDVVINKADTARVPGRDTGLFKNDGLAYFFFGLERWVVNGRYPDPAPAPADNLLVRSGDMVLERKAFAAPIERSALAGELPGDAPICALLRFRFTNQGDKSAWAELPLAYSSNAPVPFLVNFLMLNETDQLGLDGRLVPLCSRDPLQAADGRITGTWHGEAVLRAVYAGGMALENRDGRVAFRKDLSPGESCELIVKIPHVAPSTPTAERALAELDFDRCYDECRRFWRAETARGARLQTPEPILDALHARHLTCVHIADFAMPDDPRLINTSVGASTYGNFANESCMIIEELEQRGLHDEARRRLEVWLKYQGTVGLLGNFTDKDGVYYGAGGFESGEYYNQHHGWVLWALAEHYFYTGDDAWLARTAPSMLAAADFIFRQRAQTKKDLPFSRGWERGFLPAGGLEDVGDFHYWLSTNALTWRGADSCARAFEAAGHPEAVRLRHEADAYGTDLRRGFETLRQHTPLVRLRDGRWAPDYPTRLYRRGRDVGWIRETLEGSVYLLISGLMEAAGKKASWILDDYQDNRYMTPPFGYYQAWPAGEWFSRGGISMQPNLLAGLLPYLDRDEPEVVLWMFFNAWAACYREDIGAMVEHPMPVLGYSNNASLKTSDQANAIKWLRYLFVYATHDRLYLGRALPRAWFRDREQMAVEKVHTRFGEVSVRYASEAGAGRLTARVDLVLRRAPERILLRFRTPNREPLRAVSVNGKPHARFDGNSGDVDLTGMAGRLDVEAALNDQP